MYFCGGTYFKAIINNFDNYLAIFTLENQALLNYA